MWGTTATASPADEQTDMQRAARANVVNKEDFAMFSREERAATAYAPFARNRKNMSGTNVFGMSSGGPAGGGAGAAEGADDESAGEQQRQQQQAAAGGDGDSTALVPRSSDLAAEMNELKELHDLFQGERDSPVPATIYAKCQVSLDNIAKAEMMRMEKRRSS